MFEVFFFLTDDQKVLELSMFEESGFSKITEGNSFHTWH